MEWIIEILILLKLSVVALCMSYLGAWAYTRIKEGDRRTANKKAKIRAFKAGYRMGQLARDQEDSNADGF